jgi:phosphotriesterase-related protein
MSEQTGKVQTVRGLVDPGELGPTLMHEHVVTDYTPPLERALKEVEITFENHFELMYHWVQYPGMRRISDAEIATNEMKWMMESGGRTIVDVSTRNMIVYPDRLRIVSERSGAHIVMGCGRYYDGEGFFSDADRRRTVDDLVKEFVTEIQQGIDGTDVKAGIIGEIGCSCPWSEGERRSVAAAVIAQQETGALLSIHPGRGDAEAAFEIVESIKAQGADLSRTIIDHIERRLSDVEAVLRLADMGVVLEFDMFGQETSYFGATGKPFDLAGDAARLTWMRVLIDHGHLDRIVISHDICQKPRLQSFGGHGYGHIYRNVIPMMRQRNYTDREIQVILVDNPKRLLTFA